MDKRKSVSIYEYTDYRKYLRDYYEKQKAGNPAFSYRYLAKRAGFNSSGLYKDIGEGRTGITPRLTIVGVVAHPTPLAASDTAQLATALCSLKEAVFILEQHGRAFDIKTLRTITYHICEQGTRAAEEHPGSYLRKCRREEMRRLIGQRAHQDTQTRAGAKTADGSTRTGESPGCSISGCRTITAVKPTSPGRDLRGSAIARVRLIRAGSGVYV